MESSPGEPGARQTRTSQQAASKDDAFNTNDQRARDRSLCSQIVKEVRLFEDYVQTAHLLFRDAEGLDIEEVIADLHEAREELRRAYEAGASEQEACDRLLTLAAEC